ncbi:HEAT repeat domain-containing protein [Cyclobacterium salsum]|uniref:HEAT repeat domain-containing protein n=1 Tax=Cyclobacterium salsum TaxID=2666329 RepID=UPI001390E4FD|nr:HEAT repeat domain-containing protein [Cyclobacterium salsum]
MNTTEEEKINALMAKLFDETEEEPLRYAEHLARMGGPEVHRQLVGVLHQGNMEEAFLAAKTLGMLEEDRDKSLDALLDVIHKPSNSSQNGALVSLLEQFDLTEKFVDLFRIFLFGNFKASALAKVHLDYEEFAISPRTLKKAEKHWQHFLNNPRKEDDAYELKKEEAQTILNELNELFEEE